MNRIFDKEFKPKCNITIETVLAFISVLIMWVCYYIDNNNPIWSLFWGFGIIVGMNVVFPAWWVVIKKGEGFEGLGVTKNNLGIALLFSLALGLIRLPDLLNAASGLSIGSLLPVFAFNLLSIWEFSFLFSWLYTRYNRAFGKGIASLLTALSIGIYHCGTLKTEQILTLMAWMFLCALCFSVSENIFTLWPIYWIIGCSASVIRAYGANEFPWEATGLMGLILVVQLFFLYVIYRKWKKII